MMNVELIKTACEKFKESIENYFDDSEANLKETISGLLDKVIKLASGMLTSRQRTQDCRLFAGYGATPSYSLTDYHSLLSAVINILFLPEKMAKNASLDDMNNASLDDIKTLSQEFASFIYFRPIINNESLENEYENIRRKIYAVNSIDYKKLNDEDNGGMLLDPEYMRLTVLKIFTNEQEFIDRNLPENNKNKSLSFAS